MVSCFICQMEFENNTGGQLTNHVKKVHSMSLVDYTILTEYNNIPPKCKCGCEEVPHLYRGKFLNYSKGHDSFKVRENKYIEKYGYPKCLTCGVEIGFYRGNPNRYCSSKCSPGEWNQEKVKSTIMEKYGVKNLMEVDKFKEKCKKSINKRWKDNRDEILEKIKRTSLEKFGTEYPFQSDEVKKKQKDTMLKNHGVDHNSKTEKFRNSSSKRMLSDNPMKKSEVVEKMILTTRQNDTHSWKCVSKPYKSTNLTYQSTYEYDFLEFCEKNDILHLIKRSPSFKYLGKNSYHYPDFIYDSRLIVEIKSKWILDLQGGQDVISEKKKSVESSGYEYLLLLDKDYIQFENII